MSSLWVVHKLLIVWELFVQMGGWILKYNSFFAGIKKYLPMINVPRESLSVQYFNRYSKINKMNMKPMSERDSFSETRPQTKQKQKITPSIIYNDGWNSLNNNNIMSNNKVSKTTRDIIEIG